jgi:lysophospholipase L1-like esterase
MMAQLMNLLLSCMFICSMNIASTASSSPDIPIVCNGIRTENSRSDRTIIVAFGDSTTAPRESVSVFAERLQTRLANAGRAVRVINAGVPGGNTRQARERFERDVIAKHPDFATISFGINDSAVDVFQGATEPRVPLTDFERNISWMVDQLQRRGIRPILMTPNPVAWTDQLKELYAKPPYRPDEPDGWNLLLKDYAQAVRRVAKTQKVPLVDTYEFFQDHAARPDHDLNELMTDGMHPNNLGQELIADHLMKILAPSLSVRKLGGNKPCVESTEPR